MALSDRLKENREALFAYLFVTSIFTSVTVSVGIVDLLSRRRKYNDRRTRLARQVTSPINHVAIEAVREIRALGWLTGENAFLKGAGLREANLAGANLRDANLEETNLSTSNLNGAYLWNANLVGADLRDSILTGASLAGTNLAGAFLWKADLRGTDLALVNLVGAELSNAAFDTHTILPDAEFSKPKYWTPETDMTRYTDPSHPDFWQPDWAKDDNPN